MNYKQMSLLSNLEDAYTTYSQNGFVLFKTSVTDIWILELLSNTLGSVRGIWGKDYEVDHLPEAVKKTDSVSQSFEELPPHTDGTFEIDLPPSILIQCLHSDLEGFGVSTLLDGYKIIEELSKTSLEVLIETRFVFRREEHGKEASLLAPIIEHSGNQYQLRYRNDTKHVLQAPSKEATYALAELVDIISLTNMRQEIQMAAGDILWINNRRMLHGRTTLSGKTRRQIRRFWIQYAKY